MNERTEITGTYRSPITRRKYDATILLDGETPVAWWPHAEGNIYVVDHKYDGWVPQGWEAVNGPVEDEEPAYWVMPAEKINEVCELLKKGV